MVMQSWGPYRPDVAETNLLVSSGHRNVVPRADESGFAYGPMKGISVPGSGSALAGGSPRGGGYVIDSSGTFRLFVGTQTTIEQYGPLGTWTTRGSPYSVPAGDFWSMTDWGSFLLATNMTDGLLQYNVDTGGAITSVANSYFPRVVFPMFNCLFAGNCINSIGLRDPRLLRNSAINDHTIWASGTSGAGYQIMPDGQEIMGGCELSDAFGVVFQRNAIRALSRTADGSIYSMGLMAAGVGAVNPVCICHINGVAYFCDTDGFKAASASGVSLIGDQKVNRTFIGTAIAAGGLNSIQVAIDVSRQLIIWIYQSQSNSSTTVFTDAIAYCYSPSVQEFVPLSFSVQAIYTGASPGYDMDSIDTLFPSMDDPTMPDLDSRFWVGGDKGLFGINGSNMGGFFNGSNLAAVLETGTAPLERSGLVTSLDLLTDSQNSTCAVATREQLSDSKAYGDEEVISEGRVMTLARGRYVSARQTIPASEVWTYSRGVDNVQIKLGGSR